MVSGDSNSEASNSEAGKMHPEEGHKRMMVSAGGIEEAKAGR